VCVCVHGLAVVRGLTNVWLWGPSFLQETRSLRTRNEELAGETSTLKQDNVRSHTPATRSG